MRITINGRAIFRSTTEPVLGISVHLHTKSQSQFDKAHRALCRAGLMPRMPHDTWTSYAECESGELVLPEIILYRPKRGTLTP